MNESLAENPARTCRRRGGSQATGRPSRSRPLPDPPIAARVGIFFAAAPVACAAALPPGDARTRRRRVVRPTTKLNTFQLGSLKFCSNNRLFSNQKFLNYSLLSLFPIEFFRFNQKNIGRKKSSSIYITKNTVYLSIHLTVKKKNKIKQFHGRVICARRSILFWPLVCAVGSRFPCLPQVNLFCCLFFFPFVCLVRAAANSANARPYENRTAGIDQQPMSAVG